MAAAHDRPHQAGVVVPIRNQIAYSLGWAWGGVGSKTQHPIFQQIPKLADWLQQPPNAASGGCQCRNAPQRVPARHPAPKTRCAALLASVLGHKSQKMQKNTQKAKSNGHVQANTRMQA